MSLIRKKKAKGTRKTQAKIMRERRAHEADIEISNCKDKKRRTRLEKNTPKWLKHYLPGWFTIEFSPNQLEIIADLDERIEYGGTKCVAMDRGGGKTTIGKGCMLKAILCGKIHFPFVVTASGKQAKDGFIKMLIMTLETNPRLAEDYPEVCIPFQKLQGKAVRAASQTHKGEKTFISITDGIVFPKIEGSKCSNAVIKADGITSAQRGAQHQTSEGQLIRPDFIFFDDAQTDESAKSFTQTNTREEIVTSMMGMAGPGEKIAGYMACTVIQPGDLSSRFLDRKKHPEWYGTIYQMVNKWPDTKETLWEEYLDLRRQDMEDDDKTFKKSLEFYEDHFDKMNAGAEVAWEGRKLEGDLTAIQSAFHMVLTVGGWHTFMAEYQNEPIQETSAQYNINADIVASRVNYMPHLNVPEGANIITCFGDINHIGINYTVIAFKHDLTGYIIDYGKFPEGRAKLYDPESSNRTLEAQAITQGIYGFVRLISEKHYMMGTRRVVPNVLQIDGNYMTDTVYNAVDNARKQINTGSTILIPNRGQSYQNYRLPQDKKKRVKVGDNAHEHVWERGHEIRQNSDYWRMTAQKAFLLEPGVPGSLSLYGDNPRNHQRIAEEISNEKLKNYAVTDKGIMYVWGMAPGVHNDLLDAVTGCYAAASVLGASYTGMEQWRPKKKRVRRQCRQQIGG